ncbi:MAG: cysteine hydrolase family protein [Nitrososphaerales archaeon]
MPQTALVVVDMQNDFVRRGAPIEVPTALDTVPRIAELTTAFRRRGLPIVYTRFLSGPKETLLWNWSPQCAPPVCACWPGVMRHYHDLSGERDGSAIVDELAPELGDEVVAKYHYDAFFNSTLGDILVAHGVCSIVVVGTVTQICVADTVHGAFHRGLPCITVDDAVSSFDEELHHAALRNIALKYGWVMSSGDVISRLGPPEKSLSDQSDDKEEQPWTVV